MRKDPLCPLGADLPPDHERCPSCAALSRARTEARRDGVEEAAMVAEHPPHDPCAMDKWVAVADDADRKALADWTEQTYGRLDDDRSELAWLCWHAAGQYWLQRARNERAAQIRSLLAAPEPGAASPAATIACPTCGLPLRRFELGLNIEAWRCPSPDGTHHPFHDTPKVKEV